MEPYKFEKISSITSLYKSKKFLRNFTEQFYNQTIFQDVEIIIIDCNEDEEDYDSIRSFCREPNVYYERLDTDPGLYGSSNKSFPAEQWQCVETTLSTMLVDNSPHCMPTWRKSIHDDLGLFDLKYNIKADFEFWIRCLKQKKRFDKINIVMGNYYFNEEGASIENLKETHRQHSEIINKHYADQPASVFNFYNSLVNRQNK